MECEDRCGDGIIVNKPCDDNNTKSGDGCSKNCYLEFGYVCDRPPGYPCKEVIPPTFKIVAASLTNQHFIEFSEAVYVSSDTTIGPENMLVEIIGKKALYKFSWRIVPDPNNELIPGRAINRFSIKLFDIMSTLKGTENVRISFKDYS
jgi:cysteine-rich repeat protein